MGIIRPSRETYVRKCETFTPTSDGALLSDKPMLATVIGVPTTVPTYAPDKTFSVAVTSLALGPPFSETVE